jgi:hypothetical protein
VLIHQQRNTNKPQASAKIKTILKYILDIIFID